MNKLLLGLLAAALLALPTGARAEQLVCVSFFASEAFSEAQCKAALKVFDGVKVPCMATLWGTFGRHGPKGCAAKFLRKFGGRRHVLEIHFENWSGRRRALREGEIEPHLSVAEYNRRIKLKQLRVMRLIRGRAEAIAKFLATQASEDAEILLTYGLEDNMENVAYRTVSSTIKKTVLETLAQLGRELLIYFVRNPMGEHEGTHDLTGADFVELHSVRARFTGERASILNLDGQDLDFTNTRREDDLTVRLSSLPRAIREFWSRGGSYYILWWCGPQGTCNGGQRVGPRDRDFRIDNQQIHLSNQLIRSVQQ